MGAEYGAGEYGAGKYGAGEYGAGAAGNIMKGVAHGIFASV
jgi:hypothetical protein